MRIRGLLLSLFASLLYALFAASAAQAVTVGSPATDANCFPFGCVGEFPSSRYQQVYSAEAFSGPILIREIAFTQSLFPGGDLNDGTFSITLSTSANFVNELSTDFSANVGADAQLFAITDLASAESASGLLFEVSGGGTAFLYDPSEGDLLLDIQIAGIQNFGLPSFFDSRDGSAGEAFSSVHDFTDMQAVAFADSGLVTIFTPEPSTGVLLGLGLTGLVRRRRHR